MIDDMMIDDTITGFAEADVASYGAKLVKNARDLLVYKRAYRASLEIHKISLVFPKIEQFALADQLRRSTKSICANIAEGFIKQKYSSAEFGRFLAISEASAEESRVWLEYAKDLEYIDAVRFDRWDNEYLAIISMLNNLRARRQ